MRRLAAFAAALLPALAAAQDWGFSAGGAARVEYNDNYFLSPVDEQSATTVTVSPFVTGYRRTETSQVNLLAGVGLNEVFGLDQDRDYVTGRLQLDGSTRLERSTFGFNASALRDDNVFQGVTQGAGTALARGTRDAYTIGGSYGYQLTERWDIGANVSWFSNDYSNVQQNASFSDNSGYSVGGNVGYAWSEKTQLSLGVTFSHFESDITESDYVSTSFAVTHRYSQRLTFNANAGYFWSNIKTTQTGFVCPAAPILCDLGLVARVPIALGSERDDTGTLFGGSVAYQVTERTNLNIYGSQNITPSSTGVITKASVFGGTLGHSFTERLRGSVGAAWSQSTFPTAQSGSFSNDTYTVSANLAYNLTQEWLLDVGVRHTRAEYAQNPFQPEANIVFASIAYNWPGQSIPDSFGAGWGLGLGLGGDASPAFPPAAPGAGTPPTVLPGTPMQNPTPVPRAAEDAGS